MNLASDYKPEFESLKNLLVDMAQERSVEVLLRMTVNRLAERPHVALARIWLIQPADTCHSCAMQGDCLGQSACLQLVASACSPLIDSDVSLFEMDKECCRLPLGSRKLGRTVSIREPKKIIDMLRETGLVSLGDWTRRLKVVGYGLQPLIYKGEVLGVLALYSRIPIEQVIEGHIWLRMIANHAAIAIANARAFEQIEQLKKQLELENAYLRQELDEVRSFGDIVGQSPPLSNLLEQIELVAPTDASVLILGESGTGKELVAREIHKRSLRAERPLIKVNCANIPRELYESEFFGHIKGAFTGALKDRAGRFEAADGGTLFLDEVGEIPLELQSKLLRVLQEGRYERIGEELTREVNVRIIAASNRDLKREVEKGQFRRDLYYRLNVFPIEVAPLRNRKEDIPLLAAHFLNQVAAKMNRPLPRLTKAHKNELMSYRWPGNVRELQNAIERAVILSRSAGLRFDLPKGPQAATSLTETDVGGPFENLKVFKDSEMRQMERQNILAALRCTGWKIYGAGGAAEILGLKPTTLVARIKKMDIRKPDI